MKKYFILLILLISLGFRLYGINWDSFYHLHPDERMLTMVTGGINLPDNLNIFFSKESPLNPKFFPYGSFPIYLLRIVAGILSNFNQKYLSYDYLNLIGRVLSALFDTSTVLLIYLIGKKLWQKKVGLVAALFYAFCVFPIQLSHFFAVDVILTFFISLTLYRLIKYFEKNTFKNLFLISLSFGIALATKVSSILLIAPIVVCLFLKIIKERDIVILKARSAVRNLFKLIFLFIKNVLLILTISFIVFSIFEPYVLIDFQTFWKQTQEQSRMTKDAFTFPYTLQYVNTSPYIYNIKQMVIWGMGIPLGIISIIGILASTISIIKQSIMLISSCLCHSGRVQNSSIVIPESRFNRDIRNLYNNYDKYLILLSFFWIYFLTVGSFAIKFMRYFLPLYPLYILFGVQFLFLINNKIVRNVCLIITAIWCFIWSISFLSIYSKPTTRVTASNWINENIPAGKTLAREHWDDGLPLFGGEKYKFEELKLYDPDNTPTKWPEISSQLQKTDYMIIASNRLYAPLQKLSNCEKLPEYRCYKETEKYYKKLFNGSLGFKKVAEFSSYPTVNIFNFKIIFNDDKAEENFTVFDHPHINVWKKEKILLLEEYFKLLNYEE